MTDKVVPWALGLLVSLGVGHLVTGILLDRIRVKAGCDDTRMQEFRKRPRNGPAPTPQSDPASALYVVSPALQGLIERLFFTLLIAFNISATAAAMMGWLAVKMVTNLNRPGSPSDEPIVRARALTGLVGGLVSMTFALLGGLIAWLRIPLPKGEGDSVTSLEVIAWSAITWQEGLNSIGLILGMAGVALLFRYGPPQPNLEPGVGLALEEGTPLPDGRTVAEHDRDVVRRRALHSHMSKVGLALVGLGFAFQLWATWI